MQKTPRLRYAAPLFVVAIYLGFIACSKEESVNAATKMISTTLAGSRGLQASRALETSGCGGSFAACITPDTVTGKAYYAGIIVGSENGISLGPLIGTVQDASQATAFSESELLEFDFAEQLSLTGAPTLGGPIPYPTDAEAVAREFHVYVGWIDVTFTLGAGEGIVGTHVIRQVMADITGTEMKKGDKMYRLSTDTDFKWCETGACTATTRPSSPIVDSEVANFTTTNQGNKTIPSFFVSQPTGADPVIIKKSDLTNKANTNTFTLDFDMTKGVKFATTPVGMTTADLLVTSFALPAEPGDDNSGFTATLTYTP